MPTTLANDGGSPNLIEEEEHFVRLKVVERGEVEEPREDQAIGAAFQNLDLKTCRPPLNPVERVKLDRRCLGTLTAMPSSSGKGTNDEQTPGKHNSLSCNNITCLLTTDVPGDDVETMSDVRRMPPHWMTVEDHCLQYKGWIGAMTTSPRPKSLTAHHHTLVLDRG